MLGWNVYNAAIIFICVLACIDLPVRRRHDRFPLEAIACLRMARLRIGSQEIWGVTQDVSESGLSMALLDPILALNDNDVEVELPQSKLLLPSRIVQQSIRHDYPLLHLEFLEKTVEQDEALIRLIYNESAWFHSLKRVGFIDSFLIMIGAIWRAEPLVRRFR
jgi:cellulose synthase (UDP-forming)